MLEEGGITMEKKASARQSSASKNGSSADSKKNDNFSPNRFPKQGKRRENAFSRNTGFPDSFGRRPALQKSRSVGDKRPRARGNFNDRQREEVADDFRDDLGSTINYGSKKASLNHLLNFTFTRESRVRGTAGGGARPKNHVGGKPRYSKEQFLQANCQFVVKDTGDYTVHAFEADRLVDWDLIEEVRTFNYENVVCPICLHPPTAAKITRCGHVYCWACILHYLSLGDKMWRKCPICYESVQKGDLKSVTTVIIPEYKIGEAITMKLMKKERGSTYAVPKSQWEMRAGKPHRVSDELNTRYMKVLVASASEIQHQLIDEERNALQQQLKSAEESEICFIETALALLKEREELLHSKIGKSSAAAKPPEVTKQQVPDVWSTPTKTTYNGNRKIKCYASAFSDSEMTDDEEIFEEESEKPSSPESEFVAESDESVQDVTDSETAVAATVTVEKEAEANFTVGSPEVPFSTAERQQLLPDTMPPEEAAENLELPVEMESSHNKKLNTPKNAFYFYQASDGQNIFLHALNARCLAREYASLENCPDTITANIVDMERIFMTEDLRKRLRYLNHLPLTCEFQVVELALKPPTISRDTLKVFSDAIAKRRRERQNKTREEKKRSRKIQEEEKKRFGLYPEMTISINNVKQFPACHPGLGNRDRWDSQSSDTSTDASDKTPLGLNVNAPEFIPESLSPHGSPKEDGQQSTGFSFAQALKAGKSKTAVSAPRTVEQPDASSQPGPVRRIDSDESDNEDRVPVPTFHDSFITAIESKLESLDAQKGSTGESTAGSGKKKKKQKKATLLFATSMARGKGDTKA